MKTLEHLFLLVGMIQEVLQGRETGEARQTRGSAVGWDPEEGLTGGK